MDGELIKYFITQGVFAALFVWLPIDTRKDSKEREKAIKTLLKKINQ